MKRIAIIVTLTAAVVLGVLAMRSTGHAASPPSTSTTSSTVDARTAAIEFVTSSASLADEGPLARREHLRLMTTPAGFSRLADGLSQSLDALTEKLDVPVGQLSWVEVPLTASDPQPRGSTVEVDVWVVSLLGHRSLGAPQMVWRTVQVTLLETDGRWLVDDAGSTVGPTPRINELAEPSSFAEYERVAAWPPVVRGGS